MPISTANRVWIGLLLGVLFLACGVALVYLNLLPIYIIGLYILLSVFTLIVYAMDKSRAQDRLPRIREGTLHTLSLLGGWPGALVAQQALRHKVHKESFLSIFWFTVILNCGLVFGWFVLRHF